MKTLTPGTQLSRKGMVFFEVVGMKNGDYVLKTAVRGSKGAELELLTDGSQFRSVRELEKALKEGTYTITKGGYEA